MLNLSESDDSAIEELQQVHDCAEHFGHTFAPCDEPLIENNASINGASVPLFPTIQSMARDRRCNFAPKQKSSFPAEDKHVPRYDIFIVPSMVPSLAPVVRFLSVFDERDHPVTLSNSGDKAMGGEETPVVDVLKGSSMEKGPLLCRTERMMKNPVWHAGIRRNGFRFAKKGCKDWLLFWGARIRDEKILTQLQLNQRVNHIPGSWELGRKDNLAMNLRRAQRRFGRDFAVAPFSYLLPHDLPLLKRDVAAGGTFIYKPPAGACGRGIGLFTGPSVPQDILQACESYVRPHQLRDLSECGGEEKSTEAADQKKNDEDDAENDVPLVQRYIPNPLLINGYKFDLRVYVLCTSLDPLTIFVYNEGLVRFATKPFRSTNIRDNLAHLTNYSVNKRASEYVEADRDDTEASKWSLHTLKKFFVEQEWDFDAAWTRVQETVVKTFLASIGPMTSKMSQHVRTRFGCFEMYGFDILLTDTFEALLIEVNVMPSLASSSILDKHIKGHLIADTLTLVGVPLGRVTATNPPLTPSTGDGSNNIAWRPPPKGLSINRSFDCWSETVTGDLKTAVALHEDRLRRRGGFDCVFPSASARSKYGAFFDLRFFDDLLLTWEEVKSAAVAQHGDKAIQGLRAWLQGTAPFPKILDRNDKRSTAARVLRPSSVTNRRSVSSSRKSLTPRTSQTPRSEGPSAPNEVVETPKPPGRARSIAPRQGNPPRELRASARHAADSLVKAPRAPSADECSDRQVSKRCFSTPLPAVVSASERRSKVLPPAPATRPVIGRRPSLPQIRPPVLVASKGDGVQVPITLFTFSK